jgi:hypothetical protein
LSFLASLNDKNWLSKCQTEAFPFFKSKNKNAHEMCFKATCDACGKPTWKGCGLHIDSALASVPYEQRCACKARGTPPAPAQAIAEASAGAGGAQKDAQNDAQPEIVFSNDVQMLLDGLRQQNQ